MKISARPQPLQPQTPNPLMTCGDVPWYRLGVFVDSVDAITMYLPAHADTLRYRCLSFVTQFSAVGTYMFLVADSIVFYSSAKSDFKRCSSSTSVSLVKTLKYRDKKKVVLIDVSVQNEADKETADCRCSFSRPVAAVCVYTLPPARCTSKQ